MCHPVQGLYYVPLVQGLYYVPLVQGLYSCAFSTGPVLA